VERVAWTDERLDDLSQRMDAGFDRIDRDLRDLRAGMSSLGTDLRTEIAGLGAELRGEIGTVRAEIGALRGAMNRVGGGIIIGLVGVIAAIFVNGA
jgi:hypothetical protein